MAGGNFVGCPVPRGAGPRKPIENGDESQGSEKVNIGFKRDDTGVVLVDSPYYSNTEGEPSQSDQQS